MTKITAALLLLPSVALAAPTNGFTPGTLGVGPTGSAQVHVPIEVAPGLNGLQPALSIDYNSHGSGNGPLGIGFRLAGASRIHRCPKTIADYGERTTTGHPHDERLCLDGQALFPEGGARNDNVSYWYSGFYRTAEDTNVRVQRKGGDCQHGTCYFEVHQPNGSIVRYGRNGSDGLLTMVDGVGNATEAWLIRRITDVHGNTLVYDYEVHEHTHYLSRIEYGGRSVDFVYENRSHPLDVQRRVMPDFVRIQARRLQAIEARVGTELFRRYVLDYQHTDRSSGEPGPSQLSSVMVCDGAGACHAPLEIEWQSRSEFTDNSSAGNTTDNHRLRADPTRAMHLGDFDGRGRTGALTRGLHASGFAHIIYWNAQGIEYPRQVQGNDLQARLRKTDTNVITGDFNGDGSTDLVTQLGSGEGNTIKVHLALGEADFTSTVLRTGKYHNGGHALLHTGDFDGDGRTDLLRQERGKADDDIRNSVQILLSNGDGTFQTILPGANQRGDHFQEHLRYDHHYRIQIGDIDGDGLSDILATDEGNTADADGLFLRVFLSNGDGQFRLVADRSSSFQNENMGKYQNTILGDFNGDGKTDFLRQEKGSRANDDVNTFSTWLSRGDGTFLKVALPSAYQHSNMSGKHGCKLLTGDFNGDGKTDFLRQEFGDFANNTADSFSVWYSLGDGTFNKVVPSDPSYQNYMRYDYGSNPGAELNVGDFDGDGLDEFLKRPRANGGITELHTLGDRVLGHHVVAVRQGNGLSMEVELESIGAGGRNQSGRAYRYDTPPDFEGVRPVEGGIWVVREFRRFQEGNEAESTERRRYQYAGAAASLHGRGFIGFRTMDTIEEASGQLLTTLNLRDPDFAGRPEAQIVSDLQGNLLSGAQFHWSRINEDPTSGTYQTRLSSEQRMSFEGRDETITTEAHFGYDLHGNTVWEERHDGARVETQTCRSFDLSGTGSDWHRGRVLTETVSGGACQFDAAQGNCSCGSGSLLRRSELVYDADGEVREERAYDDANDVWEVTRFGYDTYGNQTSVIDPAGVRTETEYDAVLHTHPVRQVIDPNGLALETTYVFDPRFGHKLLERGPTGVAVIDTPDTFGRIVARSVDASGDRSGDDFEQLRADGFQRPGWSRIETRDYFQVGAREQARFDGAQLIRRTRIFLDHLGRELRTEMIDAQGQAVIATKAYDPAGRLVLETEPHRPGAPSAETHRGYDVHGRLASVTTSSGLESLITYGKQPGVCPDNHLWVRLRHTSGTSVREVIECRNARGDVSKRIHGSGPTRREQRFEFDRLGRLHQAWSPDTAGTGSVLDTEYSYDTLGRRVHVLNNFRGETEFRFAQGRLVEKTHGQDSWTYDYDRAGRRVAEVLPDGTRLEQSFGTTAQLLGAGMVHQQRVVLPDNTVESVRSFSYDALGTVLGETLEIDNRTFNLGYLHRSDGSLAAVDYPDGSRLRLERDQLGNLRSMRMDEGATSVEYAAFTGYNGRGQPATVHFGNGVSTQYGYDGVGRLSTVRTSSSGGTFVDNVYDWNGFGEVLAIEDQLGARHDQSFEYNDVGELVRAVGAYGIRNYAYDAHGNLTQKGSLQLSYQDGQLRSSSDGAQFEYDARGNRRVRRNGASALDYRFSGLDQLTEVRRQTRGSSCDADPNVACADIEQTVLGRYTYDAAGARVRKEDANGVVSLYVSPLYEVAIHPDGSELHTRYLNGPAGRIAAITEEVLPPAAAEAPASSSVVFAGPRPSGKTALFLASALALVFMLYWVRAASAGSGLGRARQRVFERLGAWGLLSDRSARAAAATHGTDFMRRKRGFGAALPLCAAYLAVSVAACDGKVGDEVVKVSGGAHELQRLDNGLVHGTIARVLLPGDNGDGYPVAGTHFFHPDHLGSSTFVTDALGHMVSDTVFTPFGEIFEPASRGVDAYRSKFSGKEWDAGAELYFFEARHYDPYVGRFIQADIMVLGSQSSLPSDLNRYAYAGNNPVIYTDPSGRFIFTLIAVVVAGAIINASITAAVDAANGEFSWANVGIAAAVGAVSGLVGFGVGSAATIGLTAAFGASTSLITSAALTGASAAIGGFAGGFVGSVVEDGLKGDAVDWKKAGISGAIDGATAGLIDGVGVGAIGKARKSYGKFMQRKARLKKQDIFDQAKPEVRQLAPLRAKLGSGSQARDVDLYLADLRGIDNFIDAMDTKYVKGVWDFDDATRQMHFGLNITIGDTVRALSAKFFASQLQPE